MRLWSVHPKYLDNKGLVALWREALLARHVLEGRTKGYVNHPQLTRFKGSSAPLDAINFYLYFTFQEAVTRNYRFDESKFRIPPQPLLLPVNDQQLTYEFTHLLSKLKERNPDVYKANVNIGTIEPHPLFHIVAGNVEVWEIIQQR